MADWVYEPHRIEEWVSDIVHKAKKGYFIWMDGSYTDNKNNKNGTFTFEIMRRRNETCPTCKHTEEVIDKVGKLVVKTLDNSNEHFTLVKSTVPGIKISSKHVKEYEVVYE